MTVTCCDVSGAKQPEGTEAEKLPAMKLKLPDGATGAAEVVVTILLLAVVVCRRAVTIPYLLKEGPVSSSALRSA